MNPDDVREWLQIADDDLDSAILLNAAVRKHNEIICYHCAQATEKYLKAFLVSKGLIPKKTHDLLYLNSLCESFDSDFIKFKPECSFLTKFSNDIRYPNKYQTTENDVEICLIYAEKIKNFEPVKNLRNL